MRKITGPMDAENEARAYIEGRHPSVKQILVRRVYREADVWLVEGEVWFKRAYFFTVKRSFRLQISAETGQVTSYEEARHFTV